MRYSGVSRCSFEEPLIVSGQLKMTNVQERNNRRRRSLTGPRAFGRLGVGRPYLVYIRRFVRFLEDFGEPRPVISGEEYATRLVISILWLRLKSVVGPEYAPPNTGANITRETCLFAVCIEAEPVCLAGTLPDRKTARVSRTLA